MKYLIITRKTKYGYDAHVPALPGCHSQGDTEREALTNIKDAIKSYLTMDGVELKGAKVRGRSSSAVEPDFRKSLDMQRLVPTYRHQGPYAA